MKIKPEGCRAAFGTSGALLFVPACMGGTNTIGSTHGEVCNAIANAGPERDSSGVEEARMFLDAFPFIRELKEQGAGRQEIRTAASLALEFALDRLQATDFYDTPESQDE